MKDSPFSQNKDLLQTLFNENHDIGIVIGEPHTLDKVAAALSLFLSLQASQKNVQVVSKKEPIVEVASLVGIDKLKKSFEGVINTLTISVPYKEGEVEKVSYNIEGNKLNVNLVATDKGITFREQDIQYLKKGASPSLIIAIGVSNPNDLVEMVGDTNVRVVNIDINPANQQYGDVLFTDRSFSSLSEIVGKIIQELSLPIDIDIAQNLVDGITASTNNFTLPNTSAYAFEMVGFLMKSGAKRKQQIRAQERPQSQNQGNFDRRNQQQRGSGQQNRPQQQMRPQNQPMNQGVAHTQPVQPPQMPSFQQPQVRNDQQQPLPPVAQPFEVTQPQVAPMGQPDQVPQDWFTPKIFRGAKTTEDQQ